MNAINNLKMRVKLIGGFVVVALIAALLAYLGYTNMKMINDGMTSMYFDRLVPVSDLGKVDAELYQFRGDVYKMLLIPSETSVSKTEMVTIVKDIDARIVKYKATSLLDTEVAELRVFETAWSEYQVSVNEIIAWHDAGNDAATIASLTGTGRATTARKAIAASAQKLLDYNTTEAKNVNTQADITFSGAVLLLCWRWG